MPPRQWWSPPGAVRTENVSQVVRHIILMLLVAVGPILIACSAPESETGRAVTQAPFARTSTVAPTADEVSSPAPTETLIRQPTEPPAPSSPGIASPTAHPTPRPSPTTQSAAVTPLQPVGVSPAFPNLGFERLTNLAQPSGEDNLLFVTEQAGIIQGFVNDPTVAESFVFLDITNRVSTKGNEEGLLGMAFDPDYSENGRFYVYYSASNPRRSVLSRFHAPSNDTDSADADNEVIIMEIPQPYSNHNGGQLAFGPDGYLYVGLGDGGSAGDPKSNGQDLGTLLGSVLRIDVSRETDRPGYGIPNDNPFSGVEGARGEIWAYGLRNPWRFSFDRETGELWLGDVGQHLWEEIDLIEKGGNYGWNVMEGEHCFRPKTGCDTAGLEPPVFEYGSEEGCSVIGGYVYRGNGLPSLWGAYVYADYCSGSIWALRQEDGSVTDQRLIGRLGRQITSFGQDREGNLYVLTQNSGIYELVERGAP